MSMADPEYLSVLRGKLDNLPTLNSRLVRIFISSTFTETHLNKTIAIMKQIKQPGNNKDTREERNVLLEDVYPRLKALCKEKYGMDFQLVDMRWGVPPEAADDHQATMLCIEEIRNCQKMSTGPNFVTFLNQKHGYRPLQSFIADSEFGHLKNCLAEIGHGTELMEKWYLKDENQVPPVRVLQPISSVIQGYKDKGNANAREEWEKMFQDLRSDFKLASKLCHEKQLLTEEEKHKYYMSVTEYEIITGVLGLPENAADHCLCFVRIIEDITSHLDHSKAWRFIDLVSHDSKMIDEEAQTILTHLRDEKLRQKLKDFNISRHLVKWSERDGINRKDHEDYLSRFKEAFYTSIVTMIDKAVKRETSLVQDELYIEVLQHASMANERCEMFHGREEILAEIETYLDKHQVEPLVLFGQSGCGKTSIMAQTAKMVANVSPKAIVLLRFLGTSPHSSNLWHLLKSLCQQIVICYNKTDEQVPGDFDSLKEYFTYTLRFASPNKPLVILLDSLDQLSKEHNAHKLNWLPRKLPPNVRFIVSTYTEALNLIGTLRVIFLSTSFITVPVFSTELSIHVLKSWLAKKKRTLTDDQFSLVTNAFERCSLPLFVKLTYDEVLAWKSFTPLSQCTLTYTVQESIEMLFSQLEKKHGSVLVSRALAYVTASKSGISETELEDLLSLDDIVLTDVFQIQIPPLRRIPPLLWVRIRHDISQYLVDKEVDEVRSFFWYHRQFYETAYKRYLSDKETLQEVHSLMADYYTGKWYGVQKPFTYTPQQMARIGATSQDDEADRMISAQPLIFSHDSDKKNIRFNKRKLSKLPYHLFKANRQKDLRHTCLFNYKWIQTKLGAGMLQELLLDFTLSHEEDNVLYKALKACKATLRKYPETLSIEISGRLLSLFQSKPEAHELKLLEDSIKASKKICRLVPYQPCYSVPSEANMYMIEHPRVPANTKMTAISNDSLHLAILSNENEVLLFDLVSGEMETSAIMETEDDSKFNVMVKSPGKDLLVVGKTNQMKSNQVIIVSINNCIIEKKLSLKKLYSSIGFTDDLKFQIVGNRLLVNVLRQAIDVFDTESGELLHEFEGKPDQMEMISDDTVLILHPKQTNVYTLHKLETFEQIHQVTCDETPLSLHVGKGSDLGCIVMNNLPVIDLISFGSSATDVRKLHKIDLSKTVHKKIQAAQIQNHLCLITSMEGFVLWDTKANRRKCEYLIPDALKPSYRVVDFFGVMSPDGSTLVAGYDKYLVAWDLKTGKLLNATEATRSAITNMMVSPCGQYVVHSCRRNNTVMTWKLSCLKEGSREYKSFSMTDSARYISVSREGNTAVVRSHKSTDFAVIDLGSGARRCEISKEYEAMQPQITGDGKYAVLREYNAESCLKIWDLDTGNLVKCLDYSSLHLKGYTLGTKPENMAVLMEMDDASLLMKLCHIPSGKELHQIPVKKMNMMQIIFVKDDQFCLLGIEEQLYPGVRIYTQCIDVKTGNMVREYEKMHPKMIQMITPESDCFLGQHIHMDEEGKESWELVTLKIETGEVIVSFDGIPESVLHIGHLGRYGIDKGRTVFDLKKGTKCFQFDAGEDYGVIPSKRCAPRMTSDEKYAVWLQLNHKILKVGAVATKVIISICPIHSEAMTMEVTPKNVVLIGCEDGRVMMLQFTDDNDDSSSLMKTIFSRSKRKIVSVVKNSQEKFVTGKQKTETKASTGSNYGKTRSKACTMM